MDVEGCGQAKDEINAEEKTKEIASRFFDSTTLRAAVDRRNVACVEVALLVTPIRIYSDSCNHKRTECHVR